MRARAHTNFLHVANWNRLCTVLTNNSTDSSVVRFEFDSFIHCTSLCFFLHSVRAHKIKSIVKSYTKRQHFTFHFARGKKSLELAIFLLINYTQSVCILIAICVCFRAMTCTTNRQMLNAQCSILNAHESIFNEIHKWIANK